MNRDLIFVALSLVTWGVGEGMFLYFEPVYLQQLGANPILIGSILGGVGIAMAVSYLPAGYLSDRYGRRLMLRIAWVIGMAATWIMALAGSLPIFVVGMTIYGFTSFVVVPLNSYITHARGRMTVGRTLTLISATFNAGVIIGPIIGGWIGDHYGLQRTFLIAAFFFLISTVIIFFISSQPIEVVSENEIGGHWKDIIHRRYIHYLALIFFVTFTLYLPQPLSQNYLLSEQGLNLSQIGRLIATRSLGIVTLNLVIGQVNARLGYLLAQMGMALFSLFLWRGESMTWFTAGYFLLGSYQTARSLAIAQGRTFLHSATMGIGYGLLETAMTLAIIIAPPIAGLIYQNSPPAVYAVSLVLISISLLVTIFFSPIKSRDMVTDGG